VAKIRERLAVNKQRSRRFSHKKLNEVESKERYCVEISNRFANLEDLDAEVEISSVWETISENLKFSAKESLGYFELKKHKSWLCSKLSCEFGDEPSGFMKCWETIEWPNNWLPVE
jgi:hypothetical protein